MSASFVLNLHATTPLNTVFNIALTTLFLFAAISLPDLNVSGLYGLVFLEGLFRTYLDMPDVEQLA
ncbi:hypothetical protein [Lewinella sp. 4G2]|uniref:hypothetical protein n=1 Tax=Lewinella sp. 4G2 TaxID=1803372 RepID=UPI0007E09427|nr:hypothetical protein [Lewinella sp. 4G2]OAV43601.1 hypothetical protein A3850_003410 [Lewinella sp. 4G2]